jgi:transcription antitermination factor NusG
MRSVSLSWFVVHGKINRERSIGNVLAASGFEVFMPVCRVRRQWSDRAKECTVPLFPSYIFARFDICERLAVLKAPGVISIVGRGKHPVPLTDDEVRNIRIMVDSGLSTYPWPYVKTGQTITISGGPLRGLQATVLDEDASRRKLIVSVDLLNRSIAVDIAPEWTSPFGPASSGFQLARGAKPAA